MDISQFNSRLRQEVSLYACSGRNESACFLAWYLKNFFRIEEQEAIDCVCDSPNDKGIDGIYVDDTEEAIYLFQSKFSPFDGRDQGDNDLRNFIGARQWFENEDSIEQVLASTASDELKSLINRLDILLRINSGYTVVLQFITNKIFDVNAVEFLKVNEDDLEGLDIKRLFQQYTYIADEEIKTAPVTLNLPNQTRIEYFSEDETPVVVFPIQANQLLRLQGIQDRTLFYKNVRYGLGRTRVNKEIKKTILKSKDHNNFFLYHNGITIVCESLEINNNQLTIENYTVINGCQSMLTFYENRDRITDNIYILTKVIKLSSHSPLVQQITYFANNQNAISLKDLKSNDRVQMALQREFQRAFNNRILYKIKKGEIDTSFEEIIEIDFAAQLIEALYLKNPQNTHLKAKLFGERYTEIFSRHINAAKIYLGDIIYKTLLDNTDRLQSEQIRNYGLALFFFTYLIGEILREDELGNKLLDDPQYYISSNIEVLKSALKKLWELLITEINAYIEEYTEKNNNFFDYKNVFKNSEFVRDMCRRIKSDHERILIRHEEDSFGNIYEEFLSSSLGSD